MDFEAAFWESSSEEITPKLSQDKILIVDDDPSLREFLEIFFLNEGYGVLCASDGTEALEILKKENVALVLTDMKMPEMDGLQLLRAIKEEHPGLPVIMITAFASLESAVEAMNEGAWDYLPKPFQLEEVREVVEKALSSANATEGLESDPVTKIHRLDQMVAKSPAMLKVFQLISRAASSHSSVLITGESGTGKELVARAVHNLSPRKDKPFVTLNCGGIPENLLESELFGFVKGAFTGASTDKKGLFEAADQGTIFLDEIGELPLPLQAKLLRVVQQKTFTPLGSSKEIEVNVRIVAATNRNMEEEVMKGNFREDLYYRLNVINIHIPPLRERPEDIPLLVQYFLEKYSKENGKSVQGISSFAMQALMQYPFPGNVRELENIIERSVALSTSCLILPESLSLAKHKQCEIMEDDDEDLPKTFILPQEGMDLDGYLAKIEKDLLRQALDYSSGNKTEAAKLLGLNFRSFRYRLAKYGL